MKILCNSLRGSKRFCIRILIMNTCNSINPIALGKLLKKYNLTPKNKQQVILLAQWKTATWSGLQRLARKLEFNQYVVDQQQQKQ